MLPSGVEKRPNYWWFDRMAMNLLLGPIIAVHSFVKFSLPDSLEKFGRRWKGLARDEGWKVVPKSLRELPTV